MQKALKLKILKRKSIFNKKAPEEQEQEIQKRWIEFVQEKEKEKLFYFILTKTQNNPVLIVKAPQGEQAEKKFLGYKWSGRGGYKGIEYLNGETVHNIRTPLFDPQNLVSGENKINVAIKNNFVGDTSNPLPQHCQMANLTDLIHFDKTTFDKVISLNPKKNIDFKTKWERLELGNIIIENRKSTIKVNDAKEVINGKYPFFTSGKQILSYNDFIIDNENLYLSTGGNAIVKFYNGKAAYSTDTYCITTKDNIKPYYLYQLLQSIIADINTNMFQGMALKHLQKNDLKNIKIPLPPLNIQQKIVAECEEIDIEVAQAEEVIKENQKTITEKIQKVIDRGV